MKRLVTALLVGTCAFMAMAQQNITLDAKKVGKRFDGIGIVNGGGATSVLLKDYPEPQRSEIMDMVYKPKFGASVSTLLVEIPGDGNSTQGSMPSHSHYKGDFNYKRGYIWWVLKEAKKRNQNLSLDATAWSAPGWIGNFWSQNTAYYYVSWLRGLRKVHGLELDAIGCRNERGYDYNFAKILRKTMNSNGFADVKLHGFDNWGKNKLDFMYEMKKDTELCNAIDIISAHTFGEIPITKEQRQIIDSLGKPVWNSEDHIYLKGFDCLIGIVEAFNRNYIESGATKIVNWYDIAGVYPMEPYSEDPPMLLAREPWSGNYSVRDNLWGYAHYGQFTEIGWHYIDNGCMNLEKGGSVVSMISPDKKDYSIMIETRDAKEPQTLTFNLKHGMNNHSLCVWYSDANEQFVQKQDITVKGGKFTITVAPHTVYSLSTTRGQQKGTFANIPASAPFPMPYTDNFEGYGNFSEWGYLPHYTADILGCYELVNRPDGDGSCIRQVVGQPTDSWAPEWNYYTVLGDSAWHDYEVSADVYLNPQDEAGIMGRVCEVGTGWGVIAKGYYLKIDNNGDCKLIISRGKVDKKKLEGDAEQQALIKKLNDEEAGGELVLDSCHLSDVHALEWHNLKLHFEGDDITGFIDGNAVVKAVRSQYPKGMAGLIAFKGEKRVSTPYFDNLIITPVGNKGNNTKSNLKAVKALYK